MRATTHKSEPKNPEAIPKQLPMLKKPPDHCYKSVRLSLLLSLIIRETGPYSVAQAYRIMTGLLFFVTPGIEPSQALMHVSTLPNFF